MSEKPLSGHRFDLYSPEAKKNIHEIFKQMRAAGAWYRQAGLDGETPITFVSHHEDVEALLKEDRIFLRDYWSTQPGQQDQRNELDNLINNHMLNKDGADHRRLRSLVSKAFTPRLVQGMRPHIQQIADDLIAGVRARGEMEFVAEYAFQLPTIVIAEILGVPTEDRAKFKDWTYAFVAPAMDPETQKKHGVLIMDFVEYLRKVFEQRRQQPREDLISALIQAEEDGDRLSEQELFSMVVLLIVAGHETTVNLLGNALLALFRTPELLEELRAHPEWMPDAVEEFLRYDGPVERALPRFVAEDTEFRGQSLKKGDIVIALLSSANRDAAHFESPDELDRTRAQQDHLAFGKGIHYCLGAPLARLEAEIGLNTLLQSLPGLRLDISFDEVPFRSLPMFRGLEALPVTWDA